MNLTSEIKQRLIRRRSEEHLANPLIGKINWSRHSVLELRAEGFLRTEVERGLHNCDVIEDYPTVHRPLPDCLVLGWLESGKPFHAVVALDEAGDKLLVVTVYSPDEKDWQDDWRTRK